VVEVETAFVSRQWMVRGEGYDFDLVEAPMSAGLVEPGLYDVVRLIVRPDAIVIDAAGLYRYVDTKTTGWRVTDPTWLRNLRLSLQTQLYADAIVQRYGDKAMYGGWINACEIKKLPGSSEAPPKMKLDGTPAKVPPCREHGRPTAECGPEHMKYVTQECLTSVEQVQWALDEAKRGATTFVKLMRQHAAAATSSITCENKLIETYPITNIPTEGTSNGACRFCPAADWCDSNRVMAALPSFLTYSPWPVTVGMREHAA
jgi:hypothetical protein